MLNTSLPSKVHSAQTLLLKAKIIDIEVDLARGLHSFSIVGLPDKAVEESKDRISAAIKNSGYKSPKSKNEKVVISLAPADIKKEGPFFDLPMALSYLLSSKEIDFNPEGKIFLGELSLSGEVRRIHGVLPIVLEIHKRGFLEIYLPKENAKEASLIKGPKIFPVESLQQVIKHLSGEDPIEEYKGEEFQVVDSEILYDFADIKGQNSAKRGLLIAACGGHNAAMYGPPGTGKTMLAKSFASILPPLSYDEILEVNSIHSVSGNLKEGNILTSAPIRSPHHTSSYVSMVGGGTYPKPGEITLAHKGVLFLDEMAEFEKRVIEALRQPLEDRVVSISRSRGSAIFPADFILIAALNPCPCGNFGSSKNCICSPSDINRYHKKISGPVIDRVDIWLEVSKVDYGALSSGETVPSESLKFKEIVKNVRDKQQKRFKDLGFKLNSGMSSKNIVRFALLEENAKKVLDDSAQKLDLSGRSYHRVMKVARTIADIEGGEKVCADHILEALQYRPRNMFSF